MADETKSEAAFWLSRKFWYTVMAVIAFLALALTGTVTFTNEQIETIILSLLGISVGGHAVTDIASIIGNAIAKKGLGLGAMILGNSDDEEPPQPAPRARSLDDDRITPAETPRPKGIE